MFDCVLPTRTARTGSALTRKRAAQPAERPLRARPGAARRRVRLPGVHPFQPRLHPPSRQPERAARAAPALAPQSTLPRATDPRRRRRDRARHVRLLQTRSPRKARCRIVSGFLAIVVLLGLLWVFVVLPVRRRQRAQAASHEAMQDSLAPGDEIITAGGLYAIVRSIEDERLEIEIAPDVIATLDRRAVAAVAEDVEDVDEAEIGEGEPDGPENPEGENPERNPRLPSQRPKENPANLHPLVVAPVPPCPDRTHPPRPRRRGGPCGARVADPQVAAQGPGSAGRPRGRAEGPAAEGTRAHLGRHVAVAEHHAEPRRQARRLRARHPPAGHEPDRDRAGRRPRPGEGGRPDRQDGTARALRPAARPRPSVARRGGQCGAAHQPLHPADPRAVVGDPERRPDRLLPVHDEDHEEDNRHRQEEKTTATTTCRRVAGPAHHAPPRQADPGGGAPRPVRRQDPGG